MVTCSIRTFVEDHTFSRTFNFQLILTTTHITTTPKTTSISLNKYLEKTDLSHHEILLNINMNLVHIFGIFVDIKLVVQ